MHRMWLWPVWAPLLLFTPGCGDDGATTFCPEQCEYLARCGKQEPNCVNACEQTHAVRLLHLTRESVQEMASCYRQLVACTDSCLEDTADALSPSWMTELDYSTCADTRSTCMLTTKMFPIHECIWLVLYDEEGKRRGGACLDLSCEEIGSCLETLSP